MIFLKNAHEYSVRTIQVIQSNKQIIIKKTGGSKRFIHSQLDFLV